MRRRRLVLLAVLAIASTAAKAPPEWPTGIFSNVRMSRVTGDLGGMEIRFYEAGGRRMAEFVMCEGWCNKAYKVPLARAADGFTFSYEEELLDSDGQVSRTQTLRFLAQPDGKGLKIFGWFGEQSFDGGPDRLKRISQPFGIAVANDNKPN